MSIPYTIGQSQYETLQRECSVLTQRYSKRVNGCVFALRNSFNKASLSRVINPNIHPITGALAYILYFANFLFSIGTALNKEELAED